MLEQYEEVVEDWYFHHQEERLERFLCETHILKTSEQGLDTHTIAYTLANVYLKHTLTQDT
jgi:hypothetical protein